MKIAIKIVLIFCISLLGNCSPSQIKHALIKKQIDQIDSLNAKWNNAKTPGCVVGIIQDGELIFSKGYGSANVEKGIPLSNSTLFDLGSTSKQFTAACIILLSIDDRLSLDDDIRRYIPEFPDYGHVITIRNLLHHTSGVRDYNALLQLKEHNFGDYFSNEMALDLILKQRNLNFAPGAYCSYSNSGYFLLGEVVRRVTGESLNQYAKREIFDPLGMSNTFFNDKEKTSSTNIASSYVQNYLTGSYVECVQKNKDVGPAGLFSNINDLALWEKNFFDPKVGGKELVSKIYEIGFTNDNIPLQYASGLFTWDYKGYKTYSHPGSWVGYSTSILRFPQLDFSVIVLANNINITTGHMVYEIADIVLNLETEAVEEKPEDFDATPLPDSCKRKLKSYCGKYWSYKDNKMKEILLEGNQLICAYEEEIYKYDNGWIKELNVNELALEMVNDSVFVSFKNDTIMLSKSNNSRMMKFIYDEEQIEEWTYSNYYKFETELPSAEELKELPGVYDCLDIDEECKLYVENNLFFLVLKNRTLKLSSIMKNVFKDEESGFYYFDTISNQRYFGYSQGILKKLRFDKIN